MPTSAVFTYPPEFTAEDIRSLEETSLEVTLPKPLKNPQAIRINSYSRIWRKAQRYEDCGLVAYMLRDEAGHIWRQGFHCNLRFCTNCAVFRSKRMLDHYSDVFQEALTSNPDIHRFRFIRRFLSSRRAHRCVP